MPKKETDLKCSAKERNFRTAGLNDPINRAKSLSNLTVDGFRKRRRLSAQQIERERKLGKSFRSLGIRRRAAKQVK